MAAALLLQSSLTARARGRAGGVRRSFIPAPKQYITFTHPSLSVFLSLPLAVHSGFLTSFASELSLSDADF